MRISIYLLIFLIVGSFSVLAADTGAPSPFPIWGIVSIDGERANIMSISLTYLTTGEVLPITVNGGEFMADLSEFSSRVNPDNQMKVTYCISDSRCRETSDTFTPTQVFECINCQKGIYKDLALQPVGLSVSYLVHGRVIEYGKIKDDEDVKIENIDKGYSKTIETNEAGEFQWNVANWGIYDTGDEIRVTWGDHVVTGYIFNAGLSLDIKIVHADPVVTPPQSEDNNGGNNDGGIGCVLSERIYWLKGTTCQSTCPGNDNIMSNLGYSKADYNCFTETPGEETTPEEKEEVPEDIIPEDKEKPVITLPEVTEENIGTGAKIFAVVMVIFLVGLVIYLYRNRGD